MKLTVSLTVSDKYRFYDTVNLGKSLQDQQLGRPTGTTNSSNLLTDIRCKTARSTGKPFKLTDGKGLYLMVSASGAKLWRFDYVFASKRRTLSVGQYPDISLSDARRKRDEARACLASGTDPNESKRLEKAALVSKHANTFKAVALRWQSDTAPLRKPITDSKITRWFEKDIFPTIGDRPVSDITAGDVKRVLQPLADRGVYDTAKRIRLILSTVFDHAVVEGACDSNPAKSVHMGNHFAKLKAASKTKNHAAITDPAQLSPLLRAIDGYQGSATVAAALKLAPLLFVRPGELRQAEWSEIDLKAGVWEIPAVKMKMGRTMAKGETHTVPLARQAVEILALLKRINGDGSYVFPSVRRDGRPMSDNTVNAALRGLGYMHDMQTGHGFRATARTLLDEVLNQDVRHIEMQLAHEVKDANGTAYNRTKFIDKRSEMMQIWADYLDTLRQPTAQKESL